MRILVVLLLLSTPLFQLRSQDYKKADFEPVISSPVQPGLKNGKPFNAKLEISFNFDKK